MELKNNPKFIAAHDVATRMRAEGYTRVRPVCIPSEKGHGFCSWVVRATKDGEEKDYPGHG